MPDAPEAATAPASVSRSSSNTIVGAARSALTSPGLWAAASALLAQRLLHGAFHQASFAPYSAAEWVIRASPGPLATTAIEQLGHRAQPLLAYSLIALALLVGLAAGRRSGWLLGSLAFVLTLIAAWLDPLARSVAGAFASATLAGLTAVAATAALAPASLAEPRGPTDVARRRLLARAGVVLILVGVGGMSVFRQGSRSTPSGPVRADELAVIPRDESFVAAPAQSPKITSREDHYVVDIDLQNPYIGESSWRLKVDGAVDSALSLTLDDLRSMKTEERLFNVSCISNTVGGDLIGNSRWTGVPLDALFELASPRPEAVTLLARSYDGYEEGIVLGDIRGKGALIAIGMNGLLLPRDHGFPARLLFPNHYGMRSVKWLTKLTLLDHDQVGYWAQRGWDRDAVVRTESRFDTPGYGDEVRSPFVSAGIAWAGTRGIIAVDVSPDGGETWLPAQLETELSPLSWRRWQVTLDLPPGRYTLAVRATDGTGTPQEAQRRDPHPSGASGYHLVGVSVV